MIDLDRGANKNNWFHWDSQAAVGILIRQQKYDDAMNVLTLIKIRDLKGSGVTK